MAGSDSNVLAPHLTASSYLLPSIHSFPPFFTLQPNQTTQNQATELWIRLILGYAQHHRLWHLGGEGHEWDDVIINDRIHRRVPRHLLEHVMTQMVSQGQAVYDPPKQRRIVLLHWHTPSEWAEMLHAWALSTAQMNTILTFYEIIDPIIKSELQGIPIGLLRKAIDILAKGGRAQLISGGEDGDGVRFFAASR